jgi:hypothetical protein
MATMGRPPKPIELKRATGNPGKRALPDKNSVILLPAVSAIPEPSRELLGAGLELWGRVWSMAHSWISPSTDVDLLLIVCEQMDERVWLREKVLAEGENEDRKALRMLERAIVDNLSLLGFSPTDRSRLGVAEVKKQTKLEELLARKSQRE